MCSELLYSFLNDCGCPFVGTKGVSGKGGRKACTWPEFLLYSGQVADAGGLPDTFHLAPGGHLNL